MPQRELLSNFLGEYSLVIRMRLLEKYDIGPYRCDLIGKVLDIFRQIIKMLQGSDLVPTCNIPRGYSYLLHGLILTEK